MILWTLISFAMFGGTFWAKEPTTRRRCSIGLTVWLIVSVGLLLNGIDPNLAD
jgi:hypothetical protein